MSPPNEPVFVEQPAEKAPWEQGFAAIFARDIAPGLQTQEVTRLRAVALLWKLEAGVLALAIVAWLILDWSDAHWAFLWIVVPLAAIFFGYFAARLPRLMYREGLRELVMPPVCAFLGGLSYRRRGEGGGIDPKRLMEVGLIPPASRFTLEDYFAGKWRDLAWEMVELRVIKESSGSSSGGRTTRTVYRGLLLRMLVPVGFEGVVVVSRDYGKLGNELASLAGLGRSLGRVPLPHVAFEEHFEVRSDGKARLETLLTEPVLQALLQLDQMRGGKGLTAAFADGACFIALPLRQDLFEFGSLFRSVYKVADDLHEILFQATLPCRIIDALNGEMPQKVL